MIIDKSKKSLISKRFYKKFNLSITNIRKFGVKFLFFKFILTYFDFYRIKGKFLSFKETWDYIINTNKSIIRVGDGEMLLLKGKSILYQKYNYKLEQDLFKIISNYF